jgi:hypothetical protein
MDRMKEILETYFLTLVHPFRIHQQFRYSLPLPRHDGVLYRPLTLAESLGVSWIFSLLRGLGKIILMNIFLQTFLSMQSDKFPFLQDLARSSGITTYYFLLFSAALDIVFFPIGVIILSEFWAWVIRKYSDYLDPEGPSDQIADQITTHALSSNIFTMVPILGDLIQPLVYYFLLYAGLRSNLGASKSLAFVILATPTIIFGILLSLAVFIVFCLVI